MQRGFQHVVLAVEYARLLALGDDGAVAGAGEEGRDAGAAGAQALGQRALRIEFQLQFAAQVLALEFLVLADVGGNHLPDLARAQQHAQAEAIDAGVVGDHRQAADAAVAQGDDQGLGNAAQAEAADRERLAVAQDVAQGVGGGGVEFVHGASGGGAGVGVGHQAGLVVSDAAL